MWCSYSPWGLSETQCVPTEEKKTKSRFRRKQQTDCCPKLFALSRQICPLPSYPLSTLGSALPGLLFMLQSDLPRNEPFPPLSQPTAIVWLVPHKSPDWCLLKSRKKWEWDWRKTPDWIFLLKSFKYTFLRHEDIGGLSSWSRAGGVSETFSLNPTACC